ncbi:MAG TPA: 2,3-bisphosphoglycerate-independent phosphoglycerate mutase, partial [Ktedonobacterales bacterium]
MQSPMHTSPLVHSIPRPLVLIVMDGYGINPKPRANAIALARKPNLDRLAATWPHTALATSGLAVGLPEGQMGNSEVGHMNIGAGKRVLQDFTRVTAAIHDGSFFENPALLHAIEHVKTNGSKLHLAGLLGPGGVHAHQEHLYALLRLAAKHNVERVYIHAFTDGRDTSPFGAKEYMTELLAQAREIGGQYPAKVATISGRYYAMDRDHRWERIARVYNAMTKGEGQPATEPVAAISQSYERGVTDEFIEPIVL